MNLVRPVEIESTSPGSQPDALNRLSYGLLAGEPRLELGRADLESAGLAIILLT